MTKQIAGSPLLAAFGVQVQSLRGRFYLQWSRTQNNVDDPEDEESTYRFTHGRITPVEDQPDAFILEVEHGKGAWSLVDSGSPTKLIRAVVADTRGTFHGLGSLDKSLRAAAKAGVERLPVKKAGASRFVFSDTGQACSTPDALYHYFGLPLSIIAQPARWYAYHRTPVIAESSKDRTRVLVRFQSSSLSGDVFSGTCLYLRRDGRWGAFTIRPNQSDDIATAEAWLVKRKWAPW